MILVIFEAGDTVRTDVFTHPEAKAFNKSGFIEIKVNNEILASFNPAKVICVRKVTPEDIRARAPEPQPENKNGTEAVHPASGTEGLEDSPDR